jgi:hypothetical protein
MFRRPQDQRFPVPGCHWGFSINFTDEVEFISCELGVGGELVMLTNLDQCAIACAPRAHRVRTGVCAYPNTHIACAHTDRGVNDLDEAGDAYGASRRRRRVP